MGSRPSAVPAVADAYWGGAGAGADRRAGVGAVAHTGHFRGHRPAGGRHLRRRRAWPRPLYRLHVCVRSDVDPDSGVDGRRRDSGEKAERMNFALIPLDHYLILSGVLFTIGTAGVFLRRNLITLLLSVEIMLNAVNLAFVAFGRQFGTVHGQFIVCFGMAV